MKEIDTSNMLSQLRANAAFASNELNPAKTIGENKSTGGEFAELLQNSIDQVNKLQKTSGALGKSFELGDPSVSLAEVMIAKEKAGVAFQSVLQVRKKLMEAYKEVMAMHV